MGTGSSRPSSIIFLLAFTISMPYNVHVQGLDRQSCYIAGVANSGQEMTYNCTKYAVCPIIDQIIIALQNKGNGKSKISVTTYLDLSPYTTYYDMARVDVTVPNSGTVCRIRTSCQCRVAKGPYNTACTVQDIANMTGKETYAIKVYIVINDYYWNECPEFHMVTITPHFNTTTDGVQARNLPFLAPDQVTEVVGTATMSSIATPPVSMDSKSLSQNVTLVKTNGSSIDRDFSVTVTATVGVCAPLIIGVIVFIFCWRRYHEGTDLISSIPDKMSVQSSTEIRITPNDNSSRSLSVMTDNIITPHYQFTNPQFQQHITIYVSHPFYKGKTRKILQQMMTTLHNEGIECKSSFTDELKGITSIESLMKSSESILIFCDANGEFNDAWEKGCKDLPPEELPYQPFRFEIQHIERERVQHTEHTRLVIVMEDSACPRECIPEVLQLTPSMFKYPSDMEGIIYRISSVSRYKITGTPL